MSTIWTLFRATAVVAGSSAALLMGGLMGTAHADPAAPVPAPNIGQQLVTGAPQVLQNLGTALSGQPAAPPPLASAAIKVPEPSTAGLPGATPAAPGTTSLIPGASSLVPGASPASTTATPGLGIPGLTPTLPAPATPAPGLVPVPAAAPVTAPNPLMFPVSGLP